MSFFTVAEWRCTFLTWKAIWPRFFCVSQIKRGKRWLFWSFCKVHFQRLLKKPVLHWNALDWEDTLKVQSANNSSSGFLGEKGAGGIYHACLYQAWNVLFGKLSAPYIPAMKIVKKIRLDLPVRILQILTKYNIFFNVLPVWLRIIHQITWT